jgi:hypothetical protein
VSVDYIALIYKPIIYEHCENKEKETTIEVCCMKISSVDKEVFPIL